MSKSALDVRDGHSQVRVRELSHGKEDEEEREQGQGEEVIIQEIERLFFPRPDFRRPFFAL